MHAEIRQRHENFVPRVVADTVGSMLEFPNVETLYNNVFSMNMTGSLSRMAVFIRPFAS
jgi:hypothetical protein